MQFSRHTQETILSLSRTEQASLMAGEVLRVPKHGNLYLARGTTSPSTNYEEFAQLKLDGIEHYLLKKVRNLVSTD
jgi:hypothetical protein